MFLHSLIDFQSPGKGLLTANDSMGYSYGIEVFLSRHLLTCCTELWYHIFLLSFLQEGEEIVKEVESS